MPPFDESDQERVLASVAASARAHGIAVILGTERLTGSGRQIAAFVFDAQGRTLGCQTKNQLDPTEDEFYVPGDTRSLFEVGGVKFGVAICHEGWRYPETVRWAAARGAKIVFHPQHTGSDRDGVRLTRWGAAEQSVLREGDDDAQRGEHDLLRQRQLRPAFPGIGHEPHRSVGPLPGAPALRAGRRAGGEDRLAAATGLLASRYAPERYRELGAE